MSNRAVADASLVAKLLLEEESSPLVRKLFQEGKKWVVPDILFIEIANTLATKPIISEQKVEEGLEFVYGLGLEVVETDKGRLTTAAKLAKQKGTAVYDMLYVVLAKKLGVKLVTADKNFATKTGFGWVEVLR